MSAVSSGLNSLVHGVFLSPISTVSEWVTHQLLGLETAHVLLHHRMRHLELLLHLEAVRRLVHVRKSLHDK